MGDSESCPSAGAVGAGLWSYLRVPPVDADVRFWASLRGTRRPPAGSESQDMAIYRDISTPYEPGMHTGPAGPRQQNLVLDLRVDLHLDLGRAMARSLACQWPLPGLPTQ